ncbi:hypothetical protein THRCLA_09237 [Thraustotheca clavata]|uniref:Uncharacterized protein n=1 Tax=Thraustotheca clavata TaxID=74557 RepID=A0A1V9YYQ1_9STRA|nr:hypothetical protein THRCLA_09237 [Thraustotheca clavata]
MVNEASHLVDGSFVQVETKEGTPTAFKEIILLGVICFSCPGMYNALNGLGGGGQLDTTVASNANVALYACFAVFSFIAGSIHNFLGPKLCVLLGGLTYAIYVGSLLNYNINGGSTLVILAGGLLGIGASLLWTAQGAMMLAYPLENEKGKFISAFWIVFNLGGVLGGFIPFGCNFHSNAGSVNNATYIGFMVLMIIGSFLALFLRRPSLVLRTNQMPVQYPMTKTSPKAELHGLLLAFFDYRVLCLLPAAFYSNFFYAYQFNDINAKLFTIRTRGLNNALYWGMEMVGAYLFGNKLMDVENWSRTYRAKVGLALLLALCLLTWGLGVGLQSTYTRESNSTLIDFTETRAAFPMIVYLLFGFLDAVFQTYVYWLIGALTNDAASLARIVGLYKAFQSAGGAISWKIDVLGADYMLQLGINWGLILIFWLFLTNIVFGIMTQTTTVIPEGPPHKPLPQNDRISQLRSRTKLAFRFIDILVNIYSLVAFLMTSSLIDIVLMREAVFMDDVTNGLYDFPVKTSRDQLILDAMHNAKLGQSKSVGYQDKYEAFPTGNGTASWCHRINMDLGTEIHISYYGDGISRRYLRKTHTNLPQSCTGWTVAPGMNYDAPRLHAVQDGRQSYGQSYLHCTDPRLYTSNSYQNQTNFTSFAFRAGYVVAQQHYAGAQFGIETQQSHCKAEKIGDTTYYKVSPRYEGDTRAYVTILFTDKDTILYLLDYGGQLIVIAILCIEIFRSAIQLIVMLPTKSYSIFIHLLHKIKNTLVDPSIKMVAGGSSVLSFSQVWLVSPWYLIGNCMYALGTSIETQMIVEVMYWEYQRSHDNSQLFIGGVYAMRHAWVSVAVWTVFRVISTRVYLPFMPICLRTAIKSTEAYCSSRIIVLAFILSSIVATFSRGHLYLYDITEITDVSQGVIKSAVWQSEVVQSLLVNHFFGILFGMTFGLCSKFIIYRVYPPHYKNSLIRAIDKHRLCAGFDMVQLLSTSHAFIHQGRCVLLLPLADVYLIYSSVNLLNITAIEGLEDVRPAHAIELETNQDGTILIVKNTDIYISRLVALQERSDSNLKYLAIKQSFIQRRISMTTAKTERNTAKVQRYRRRLQATREELIKQVQHLQDVIVGHKLTAPLGWNETCEALAESSEECQQINRQLKAHKYEMDQVIVAMTKWVHSMMAQTSIQSILPIPLRWSRTSLAADRTSRKLGFDWYTLHLLSNMDRFIEQCHFPPRGFSNNLTVIENDDETMHFVWSYQCEYAMPLSKVYAGIRLPIWRKLRADASKVPIEMLDQELLDEIDNGKMMYRRVVVSDKRSDVLLTREFSDFNSSDRIAFVSGNIHEDALLPESHYLRNRMFWHVLEPLSPTCTRLRVVWTISSFLSNKEPVTWLEEAAVLKRDLGDGPEDETSFATFRQTI